MPVDLWIYLRTYRAYSQSILVDDDTFSTTRTPCFHLDLAVPNERLFKEHYKEALHPYDWGCEKMALMTFKQFHKKPRFYLDDTTVGTQGRSDSNSFCSWASVDVNELDVLVLTYFDKLYRKLWSLTSGDSVVRFLNFAKLTRFYEFKTFETVFRDSKVSYGYQTFCSSVIEGFCRKRSENPLLFKEVWDVYCVNLETRCSFFTFIEDAEHFESMISVAERAKFDLWGLKHGVNGLTEEVLNEYICKSDRINFITILLNHGYSLGKTMPGNSHYSNVYDQSMVDFLDYGRQLFVPSFFMIWLLVLAHESSYFQKEKKKEFIEMFEKMSRTIPQPSLPPRVVREHLKNALLPAEKVEDIVETYEACDVHPSESDVVAPPKLSHLSRCLIRERLAANYKCPSAIDELPLPKLLKRYLRLDF